MEDVYAIIAVCTTLFLAFAFAGCVKDYREFKHRVNTQESCDHRYVLDTKESLVVWNKDFTTCETVTRAKCCLCDHETVRKYIEQNEG